MKIKPFIVIDYIFKYILIFSINIVWFTYFFGGNFVALNVCLVFSLLMLILLEKISSRKEKNKKIKATKLNHIEDVNKTFIFTEQNNLIDFFYKLFSKKDKVEVHQDYLEIIKQDKKIAVLLNFKYTSLNADKLIELVNKTTSKKYDRILILCSNYDINILNVLDNFKTQILVLDYKQTYYNILEKYEFYPEIIKTEKAKPKKSFALFMTKILDKKKTKSYIFSAFVLLFYSLFVSIKIYYYIIITLLLTLAILSKFNVKFTNPPQKILD